MAPRNPYTHVHRLRRRHQRAQEHPVVRAGSVALPLAALALLVPLFQQLFLSWLQFAPEHWASGMEQVLLRVGIALVGWLSLDTYSALIRGDGRTVLAVLPVDPAQVVAAELLLVAQRRLWLIAAAAALLAPVALAGAPGLWALGVISVSGSWVMGLIASAAVHLLAVEVAESPRWAPALDLLRGSNPRPQAAFLYAPGVALLLCGGLLAASSWAAGQVWTGQPLAGLWLVAPFLGAALAAAPLPRLARGSWFRASAVLAEIDARYAALVDREEALRVYLDWVVRGLPAQIKRYALKDLRHGWRARRTLIMGAWLLALAAVAAGWTTSEAGPLRATILSIGGVWLCASVGVLLEADEPDFMRAWLPSGGGPKHSARALVLTLWLQPIVWVPAFAVSLRAGAWAGLTLWLGAQLAVLAATLTAMICAPLKARAMPIYAPLAAVLGAGMAVGWGAL